MSAHHLSSYFTLDRRYSRSINLERDLVDPTSLSGYVLTERSEQTLRRLAESFAGLQPMRAWMLTGIYGTGKSAFGHFLASLCMPPKQAIRKKAVDLLNNQTSEKAHKIVSEAIPAGGFFCAAATAQREPISHTIVRALIHGHNSYWHWKNGRGAEIGEKLLDLEKRLRKGKTVATNEIINLIQEIAQTGKTGVLLLIDELGKCLEFAAQNRDQGDLYVLQQIAELMSNEATPVFLVGILHQAFSEYSYGLGTIERNEWTKIQGRFVEIPFTESALQMSQLMGQVIQRKKDARVEAIIGLETNGWHTKLSRALGIKDIPKQVLTTAFPLHPVTTLVLPQLCIKYAQNDRSLFTFLTGTEPHSFRTWLDITPFNGEKLTLLKLENLYDYFVDAAGIGMASRPNFQRWVEVKNLIDDYHYGDPNELRLLKTIGILNLASVSGTLKATRQLTVMALCDSANDKIGQKYWDKLVERLIERGLLTYRQQVDELRIWEGSDFDIGDTLTQQLEKQRESLAELLTKTHPLRPLVAQRHSYQTGALRFFECKYLDSQSDFATLQCISNESVGMLVYWVDDKPPHLIPTQTVDHKPLVFLEISQVETLRLRARELMALKQIQTNAAELQSDGIARREVRYRVVQSQQGLDDIFAQTVEGNASVRCSINGQTELLNLRKSLNARLSQLCDEIYRNGLTLWNEIINRQELTSQGSMASRQVITRMLEQPDLPRLGLEGNGPEVSVYYSVLQRTGIHREEGGVYGFHRPTDTRLHKVWDEIENFCLAAKDHPVNLEQLYQRLKRPPFGVKTGLIPILFAAVIFKHADNVSLYRDDIFIPVLGAEHFELFVKHPARFAVKHYEVFGLRAEVFREIEGILANKVVIPQQMRNRTLLGVISPLLQFARRLPQFTQKTKALSVRAQAVRQVLLAANEPDKLIFELLPQACELEPIADTDTRESHLPKEFRIRLMAALKEIQGAYDNLLLQCRDYIHEAFATSQDVERLRENLRVRASFLQGRSIEPILTRFVFAATDDLTDEAQWLKAVIMVIADKPSESWTDADKEAFELKLIDVARRFKYLEAIATNNSSYWASQAEAKRISIIGTDGREQNEVAWIEEGQRTKIEKIANRLLDQHNLNINDQRVLLAILAEKVLNSATSVKTPFQSGRNLKVPQGGDESETHSRNIRREG